MHQFLMPHWIRYVGTAILLSGIIMLVFSSKIDWQIISPPFLMVGLYFMIFSKQREEDERIRKIRYQGLLRAFGLLFVISLAFIFTMAVKGIREVKLDLFFLSLPFIISGLFYLGYFYVRIWYET